MPGGAACRWCWGSRIPSAPLGEPGTDEQWHEYWIGERHRWYTDLGIEPANLRLFEHSKEKLSHYSKRTVDIDARIVDNHISASTRTFVPNTPSTTQSMSHDKQHASVDNRNDPFGEMPLQQHCFAAFVATSVTLIFAIPAHDGYRLTQAFDRESTVVNGRVIRFQQGQNGNLSPVVAYSFEGRSYEHPVPSKDGRYNMDALRAESFRVRLLKSSPEVALVSNWEQPPVYWPLATIAGAAGFVSSCLLLSLLRRVVQRFI